MQSKRGSLTFGAFVECFHTVHARNLRFQDALFSKASFLSIHRSAYFSKLPGVRFRLF